MHRISSMLNHFNERRMMILDTTSSSRTDRPSKAAKPAASAPRSTASASQRSASAPSSGTHRKRRRRFTTIVYFSLLLVYLEVIFHILMFHNIRFSLIYPILFALTLGTVLGTICRLFKRQVNRILMVTFTAILCVLSVQRLFIRASSILIMPCLAYLVLPDRHWTFWTVSSV